MHILHIILWGKNIIYIFIFIFWTGSGIWGLVAAHINTRPHGLSHSDIRSLCYEYVLIYSDIYTPSLQSFSTITPILPSLPALLFSQMFLIVQRSPFSQYSVLAYCTALMDGSIIIIVNKHLENRIQNASGICKRDRSSLYEQRWKDHITCILLCAGMFPSF